MKNKVVPMAEHHFQKKILVYVQVGDDVDSPGAAPRHNIQYKNF